MPIVFDKGCYPSATIMSDAHGCLHLFEGSHIPSAHPTLPKVKGKEADRFFQSQADIEAILGHLTDEEQEYVYEGYTIITKNIPDDYFHND